MTDNEIIKALGCCTGVLNLGGCYGCPFKQTDDCLILDKHALSLINRQKAEIESLNNEIDKLLKRIPASDAVEVVRCKDCRFYITDSLYCRANNTGYCADDEIIKSPNHFCGYGERRTDDAD